MTKFSPFDQLFVYGTLRMDLNHEMYYALARNSVSLGKGWLHGELYDLGSYPGIFLAEGCRDIVRGEIYALKPNLTENTWRTLDDYEGCGPDSPQPHEFVRQRVRAHLIDGSESDVWAYILPARPTDRVRVAGGDYVEWCRQKQAG